MAGFDPEANYVCIRGETEFPECTLDNGMRLGCQITADPTFTFVKRNFDATKLRDKLTTAFGQYGQFLGGPSSLTTTLLGAGLGGLGGWSAGRIADKVVPGTLRKLLPKQYGDQIEDTSWTPLLTGLGAGVGAMPGLGQASMAVMNGANPLSAYPWNNKYGSIVHPDSPVNDFNWEELDAQFEKNAEAAGGLFVPSIPVDAFNRAVWSNANPNQFGTRDAFGDNERTMHTPPPVASAITGLVSTAGLMTGKPTVSPWDVAQVAANVAQGGLTGLAVGIVAGKTLSALAGAPPAMQQYLQQTGTWAGALTGLVQQVF